MISYVLINCIPKKEKKIISQIKKIPNVVEVNGIIGNYDIFVKISAKFHHKVDQAILKLRNIEGITASYSMPVLYGQGGTIHDEEDL